MEIDGGNRCVDLTRGFEGGGGLSKLLEIERTLAQHLLNFVIVLLRRRNSRQLRQCDFASTFTCQPDRDCAIRRVGRVGRVGRLRVREDRQKKREEDDSNNAS